MAGLDDIFGNQTLRTIFTWQVAAQVLGSLMAPFLEQLTVEVNHLHPEQPLSAAEVADMVLRGWLSLETGQQEAEASGINNDRFKLMVDNTGEPPGLAQLLEAYRRGIIPKSAPQGQPALEYGIRTSRLRDEWIPVIEALRFAVPSAAEAVTAAVRNELSVERAKQIFEQSGLDPDTDWDWLYATAGNPPGLADVATLVHRGIVPQKGTGPDVTSFEQAVAESSYKNKWADALWEGFTYIPPVRTVVALLRAGAVDQAQAAALFAENGVRPADAAAYIAEGTGQAIATDKQLAKSDIEQLYQDQAIDNATATTLLGALGYGGDVAAFLLELVDLRRERTFLEAAISKIHTYYVARKVDKAAANSALSTLHVPAPQIADLLAFWDIEQGSNVRLLTESQIVDAWGNGILDQPTATAELVGIGYTEYDAWVLLSNKNKGPLGTPPAKGPAPSGNVT